MPLFHEIPEAQIITRSRGVYKQVKLYRRGDDLYAGHGSGFVRLLAGGGTSAPNVSWQDPSMTGVENVHKQFIQFPERGSPRYAIR